MVSIWICLVVEPVEPSEKYESSSVGMMKLQIYDYRYGMMKIEKIIKSIWMMKFPDIWRNENHVEKNNRMGYLSD